MGIRPLPRFAHLAAYYNGAKQASIAVAANSAKPHTTVLRCDHCGAPLNPPDTGDRVQCPYCDSVNVIWREVEAQPSAEPLSLTDLPREMRDEFLDHVKYTNLVDGDMHTALRDFLDWKRSVASAKRPQPTKAHGTSNPGPG